MDGAMRHERAASRRGFEFRRDFRARNTGGSPAATAGATERRYQPCGTLRGHCSPAGSNGKIPGGQNDQKAETARNRQHPIPNGASPTRSTHSRRAMLDRQRTPLQPTFAIISIFYDHAGGGGFPHHGEPILGGGGRAKGRRVTLDAASPFAECPLLTPF